MKELNIRLYYKKWILWSVLGSVAILSMLSANAPGYVNRPQDTNTYYKAFLNKELTTLASEITHLQQMANAYKASDRTLKQLQNQVLVTRLAYKRIEGMATYYFPKHVDAYINGAPLDHLTPLPGSKESEGLNYYSGSLENYKNTVPLDMLEAGHYSGNNYSILPPEGLQRIDELVFSEEVSIASTDLQALTDQLHRSFTVLKEAMAYRKYHYDFEVLEASRLQLVRIVGRGITGFDTPGSLNAMAETSASLSGLQELLYPLLKNSSSLTQKKVNRIFKGAASYLNKNTDFDTFDRLVFIKSYINPLYAALLEVQKELALPSSAEKFNTTPSWNYNSTNLFDAEFLNPYYYSMLKASEDSPQLGQLGERLFFDKQLSSGNTMNCASCHNPQLAYTDGQTTALANVNGKRLNRNSPTLINAVFSDRYFYDLRAFDLEDQLEHVIENHLEFDTDYHEIIEKLNQQKAYTEGFKTVYGTDRINRYQVSSALASYVISLRSFNSEFDTYMRDEIADLDAAAKRGFNLFMGKANCATCHYAPTFSGLTPPLFQENESEVLGVLKRPGSFEVDQDLGRMKNGIKKEDQAIYNRSFKTTTVRNVGLTAPYFHNGAYETLEEVIDFYNSGGAAGLQMSYEVPNQTLSPDPLNLSDREIQDIKAFMLSLSDLPNPSH